MLDYSKDFQRERDYRLKRMSLRRYMHSTVDVILLSITLDGQVEMCVVVRACACVSVA